MLAAGAVLNPLIIGHMIRCGPALPALLLCAYAVGRQPVRLSRVATERGAWPASCCPPRCSPSPIRTSTAVSWWPWLPMILGLYGVGRLVKSRTRLAADLEQRNEQLRQQRERRADLAVQADRARIAEGLDASLNAQITEMGAAAESGRQALAEEQSPEAAARGLRGHPAARPGDPHPHAPAWSAPSSSRSQSSRSRA